MQEQLPLRQNGVQILGNNAGNRGTGQNIVDTASNLARGVRNDGSGFAGKRIALLSATGSRPDHMSRVLVGPKLPPGIPLGILIFADYFEVLNS